jgi:outer membrane protein TolC
MDNDGVVGSRWQEFVQDRRGALALAIVCALSLLSKASFATPRRLSLNEAVARARSNPLARAAIEQQRAAEARLAEARGARFPRGELTSFIAPGPDIRCLNADCTRTDPHDPRLAVDGIFGGVRLGLFQPLYTFGKIDGAIDAASSAVRASDALTAATKADLAFETTRAYFGVVLARDLGSMLDDGGREITKAKENLNRRLEQGDDEVTVQDRLRLETLEAEVALRSSEAREGETAALLAFRALVGDENADTELGELAALSTPLADAKGYVTRSTAGRPELRAAREGVAALEGVSRMEHARLLPDFLLMGGFRFARATGVDDPPSAFANDPFNTTAGEVALVMRWTLEPASQIARVERAEADVSRARALLDAAGRAGGVAVRQAHSRAVEARARLAAAKTGEKAARGWVVSVLQAQAVGTASAKDLADAYIAYFMLRARVLQSTFDWNVAIVALRRAAGDDPSPPNPRGP